MEESSADFQAFADDDYERAEKQIFSAIRKLERNLEKVMEREVDTLFHELEHHDKVAVKKKAQRAVKKGAKKVKSDVGGIQKLSTLPESYHYPYDWPHGEPEHRLLQAIESAEKAVLHAVQNEVNSLFHQLENHDEDNEHKVALTKGVVKAGKHLDQEHESRRSWFLDANRDGSNAMIEEYNVQYFWAIQ